VARRLAELEPAQRTKSRDFRLLYELAMKEGPGLLGSMGIDHERASGLITDLFLRELDKLVTAQVPFPYFVTSVRHAGIDWLRKTRREVVSEPKVDRAGTQDEASEAVVHLRAVWQTLTPKEREIFSALQAGEDRDGIARSLRTSRANIDQLISRARKRLKDGGYA
jgi:RNA polymerase sigma factor (sigma-70 family)